MSKGGWKPRQREARSEKSGEVSTDHPLTKKEWDGLREALRRPPTLEECRAIKTAQRIKVPIRIGTRFGGKK